MSVYSFTVGWVRVCLIACLMGESSIVQAFSFPEPTASSHLHVFYSSNALIAARVSYHTFSGSSPVQSTLFRQLALAMTEQVSDALLPHPANIAHPSDMPDVQFSPSQLVHMRNLLHTAPPTTQQERFSIIAQRLNLDASIRSHALVLSSLASLWLSASGDPQALQAASNKIFANPANQNGIIIRFAAEGSESGAQSMRYSSVDMPVPVEETLTIDDQVTVKAAKKREPKKTAHLFAHVTSQQIEETAMHVLGNINRRQFNGLLGQLVLYLLALVYHIPIPKPPMSPEVHSWSEPAQELMKTFSSWFFPNQEQVAFSFQCSLNGLAEMIATPAPSKALQGTWIAAAMDTYAQMGTYYTKEFQDRAFAGLPGLTELAETEKLLKRIAANKPGSVELYLHRELERKQALLHRAERQVETVENPKFSDFEDVEIYREAVKSLIELPAQLSPEELRHLVMDKLQRELNRNAEWMNTDWPDVKEEFKKACHKLQGEIVRGERLRHERSVQQLERDRQRRFSSETSQIPLIVIDGHFWQRVEAAGVALHREFEDTLPIGVTLPEAFNSLDEMIETFQGQLLAERLWIHEGSHRDVDTTNLDLVRAEEALVANVEQQFLVGTLSKFGNLIVAREGLATITGETIETLLSLLPPGLYQAIATPIRYRILSGRPSSKKNRPTSLDEFILQTYATARPYGLAMDDTYRTAEPGMTTDLFRTTLEQFFSQTGKTPRNSHSQSDGSDELYQKAAALYQDVQALAFLVSPQLHLDADDYWQSVYTALWDALSKTSKTNVSLRLWWDGSIETVLDHWLSLRSSASNMDGISTLLTSYRQLLQANPALSDQPNELRNQLETIHPLIWKRFEALMGVRRADIEHPRESFQSENDFIDFISLMRRFLNLKDPRRVRIVLMKNWMGYTLEAIAQIYGLTGEGIRLLNLVAINQLREIGDYVSVGRTPLEDSVAAPIQSTPKRSSPLVRTIESIPVVQSPPVVKEFGPRVQIQLMDEADSEETILGAVIQQKQVLEVSGSQLLKIKNDYWRIQEKVQQDQKIDFQVEWQDGLIPQKRYVFFAVPYGDQAAYVKILDAESPESVALRAFPNPSLKRTDHSQDQHYKSGIDALIRDVNQGKRDVSVLYRYIEDERAHSLIPWAFVALKEFDKQNQFKNHLRQLISNLALESMYRRDNPNLPMNSLNVDDLLFVSSSILEMFTNPTAYNDYFHDDLLLIEAYAFGLAKRMLEIRPRSLPLLVDQVAFIVEKALTRQQLSFLIAFFKSFWMKEDGSLMGRFHDRLQGYLLGIASAANKSSRDREKAIKALAHAHPTQALIDQLKMIDSTARMVKKALQKTIQTLSKNLPPSSKTLQVAT